LGPDQIVINRILRRLAKEYPAVVEISCFPEIDTPECHRALFFLAETGLVESVAESPKRSGQAPEMLEAKITARGLSSLDDRQFTNNTINQSFNCIDPDAFRTFLSQEISRASLDESTRSQAIGRIKQLTNREIDALSVKLIAAAVRNSELLAELIAGLVKK
jgi:hypothetical protein